MGTSLYDYIGHFQTLLKLFGKYNITGWCICWLVTSFAFFFLILKHVIRRVKAAANHILRCFFTFELDTQLKAYMYLCFPVRYTVTGVQLSCTFQLGLKQE